LLRGRFLTQTRILSERSVSAFGLIKLEEDVGTPYALRLDLLDLGEVKIDFATLLEGLGEEMSSSKSASDLECFEVMLFL
jgi:hypothetical protein